MLTMREWIKAMLEFKHLRRKLTTPAHPFVQIHARARPGAPATSTLEAESLNPGYLHYLVCGNDNVDAFEHIIPYPLFSPEVDIVGSREYPCLICW